jgi:hypothetical protein
MNAKQKFVKFDEDSFDYLLEGDYTTFNTDVDEQSRHYFGPQLYLLALEAFVKRDHDT